MKDNMKSWIYSITSVFLILLVIFVIAFHQNTSIKGHEKEYAINKLRNQDNFVEICHQNGGAINTINPFPFIVLSRCIINE